MDPNKWKITRLIPQVCHYLAQSGQSLTPVKGNIHQALIKGNIHQALKTKMTKLWCYLPNSSHCRATRSTVLYASNFTLGRLVGVL